MARKGCPAGFVKAEDQCVPKLIMIEQSGTGEMEASIILHRHPHKNLKDWLKPTPMHKYKIVERRNYNKYVALQYERSLSMGKKSRAHPSLTSGYQMGKKS